MRQLRYLIAVAEEQSFVGAAERLHLAQPALSRQIQGLERELGVRLFERDTTGTWVTPAGESAARCARRIVDDLRVAIDQTRSADRGLAGVVVLGAGRYPIWNGMLAQMVGHVKNEYPGIEIVIDERGLGAQWKALAAANIDIVFGTAPPADFLEFAVETHSLDVIDAVVVSRDHELAARDRVSLSELRRHTWIRHAPSVGDEPTRILQSAFLSLGFAPARTRHALHDDALRMLVRAGAGFSALPHSLRAVLPRSLVAIPVEDLVVPFRYVHAHRRADHRPAVRSVLSAMRRAARIGGAGPRALEPEGKDTAGSLELSASRLELRHLRYFVAAVEHESIGRAAKELGITQPALSRQIRDLENEVGAPLLQRTARGIRPTLAGETFFSHASGILKRTTRVGLEAQRAQRGTVGRCVIGVASSPAVWDLVTGVLTAFEGSSDIEVVVEDIPTPRQPAALAEGALDLALGHVSVAPPELVTGIARQVLLPDALNTALVSRSHPLAGRSSATVRDFADLPLLFMKRSFSPTFYDQVMSQFARANHTPRLDGGYDGLPTIWALTAEGMGWCLGSESQRQDPPAGLVGVPLTDFTMPWGCELFYRRDESRTPVLEVLRLLQEAARNLELAA